MNFFPSRRRHQPQKCSSPKRYKRRLWVESLEERTLFSTNPIVLENQLAGTPQSVWDINGQGDLTIQGFATDISVNRGQTVAFKINDTAAAPYHIDIYRMGYYGGMGARRVATIASSQTLARVQDNPIADDSVGLVDAGNWSVTASWAVPANATSGVYFAKVIRDDTGGASHILFVVRDDQGRSDVLFKTSDATWQAYNQYGGSSLYVSLVPSLDRAYKVSYNRPFDDRSRVGAYGTITWVFSDEYPMVRWVEANGYNVSYFTDIDADRYGPLIQQHQLFLSVGHDEYWSAGERANVEAARDAGVNLAFFSGNEVFWKTRWETSTDASRTPYRTLVSYKETHAGSVIDPNDPPTWTGTWQDPRFSPPADGGRPQNSLTGTFFMVNGIDSRNITVPAAFANLRFWRNTSVASLLPGQTATLANDTLGFEWDVDVDNGFRPGGLIDLSSTTASPGPGVLSDYGSTYRPGTATHSLTLYRASSGALVFGAGTVRWSWGLDGNHDDGPSTPDVRMQQATVNLLADMYVQPQTLQPGLVPGIPSTDAIAPTSTVTSPSGGNFMPGVAVTITGTASDSGGGVVAGVEVSTDGGRTWHRATSTTSWSYTWIPDTAGPVTIKSRATDDSCNIEQPSAGVRVTVSFPPTNTAGLVAAYNFDQGSGTTLTDVSGHGNSGTIVNGTWTTGLFGGALSFDGLTSVVTIPNSPSLQLTSGMTLEAWVYPAAVNNASPVIVKTRSGGLSYGLYSSDGTTSHANADTQNSATPSSGADTLLGNAVLRLNSWSHLAATYDGFTLRFYINGTQVTSLTLNYTLLTGTGALQLGGDSVGNNFAGLMDEVRIYNRALSQGEIRSDLSTPFGGTLESTPPTVSLTAPNPGATVSGITTISATASDDVMIGSVQFLLNGVNLGAPLTSVPYSLAWDTRTLANGPYTLSARATDMAGNTATSSGVTVNVNNPPDTIPPTVRLMGPLDGSIVAGTTVFAAFASDNVAVASVQFQLNGVNAGPALTASPYRLGFDTRPVASGTYTLTAVARDLAGNTTTSSSISLTIDNTPPRVTSQTPAAGATGVSTATVVTATFSKAVQPATISFVLKDAANNTVSAIVTYNPNNNTATLTPNNALVTSAVYTATVSGALDLLGNPMAGPVSWSFTTSATLTGAMIFGNGATPAVASTSDPNAAELGVKFRSDVPGTVTGLRFYKGPANTGTHVGHLWTSTGTLLATATFSSESASGWQQVTFSSPVAINAGTTYVASYYAPAGGYAANTGYFSSSGTDTPPLHALANGVDGPNGVYLYATGGGFPTSSGSSANYWVDIVFTASATVPAVTAQTPAPNATGVATSTAVTATFNEAVIASSISFVLRDPAGNTIAATVNYNSFTLTVTLTPNVALGTNTTYTATVSGATDSGGHTMTAPVSWSFTTTGPTVSGNTIWASTTTPAVLSANDGNAIEVGVKFRSDVPGTIVGLRFYKGPANTGTHVGHLWSNTGTLLATATFGGESASGWQQVSLSSAVTITAGTTYVVSYYAPSGGYSTTSGYFATSGADNPPLHALANGVDGPNGVYLYGTGGGFPNQTYGSTNYWIDVVFNPASGTVPTVTAQTPAPNASGVATSTTVTATFNEAVIASSISFVLRDGAGNAVAATLTYNSSTFTATLTPNAALGTNTTYTATVSGATDSAGRTMTGPVSWSFTTTGPTVSGNTIWASTTTPAVLSANDGNAIEVGVKFRSDVPGTVTGLRFYKGPSNPGTHIGHLWTSNGTLLATATFTGESTSGWQQVTLSSPVSINAGATYVASYYAPSGGYATTSGYFATAGADSPPLHALANGVDGPNGVYLYATGGGFPNQTYGSANYWVDVVFSPSNAPTVTGRTPAVCAAGVSRATTVTATFSMAVQAASISFVLRDAAGNTVASSVSYNSSTLTATLTPNASLVAGGSYTATVSATSVSGVPMGAPATWTFSTMGVWLQTTVADFSPGTHNGTTVTNVSGGEVQLAPGFSDDFIGSTLSSSWTNTPWVTGGGVTLASSILSVRGTEVLSTQIFADVPVEGSINFAALPYQHFGVATDVGAVGGNSWAIFSTMGTTNTLFARVNAGGATQDLSLGALPAGFHVYRVQPMPGAFQFYIDGVLQTTITASIVGGTPLKIALSSYPLTAPGLQADWVRQAGGTFTSTVFDATRAAVWDTVNWTASVPTGTTMIVETRSGNTATPDGTWANWTTASSGGTVSSPGGRYLQYRVRFITTNPTLTPILYDITFNVKIPPC